MTSSSMLSRRTLLRATGAVALSAPVLWQQAARAGSPPPEQLHLTFGADASSEMTVSWTTAGPVSRPGVRLGTPGGGPGSVLPAETRTYRDAATKREVYTHHVRAHGLVPSTEHVYEVGHDGATPVRSTFRTGPRGRGAFRFTSFGDQGVDDPALVGGSLFSSRVVGHVEQQQPLLHLLNGDLAYSDLNSDPGAAWDGWMRMNERSTRVRPWMPAAGNHENELGNGENGYRAFQTRYALPDNGLVGLEGLFYAFTVGSVRFVVLQNDDACYQDAGDSYVRGYSGGAQRRWLERTLASARTDRGVDWVVVVMHQLVASSALTGNGSDLGVREEFAPLFDRYGVDLVLAGHDHDYERSHPVRGVEPGGLHTPRPVATRTDVVDTSRGTVHLTLGGGGSFPLNGYFGAPASGPRLARVITGRTTSDVEVEQATWSAVTDPVEAFGFASFDVDPGTAPGGTTRMKVTYYRTALAGAAPTPYDVFELQRPRGDG